MVTSDCDEIGDKIKIICPYKRAYPYNYKNKNEGN
jgi:hypothetical protein